MEIQDISKSINDNAKQKGFWQTGGSISEKLMLIVTEVAEACEADRKNRHTECNIDGVNGWVNESDFINAFKENVKDTFEDELADIVIRVFDLAYQHNINLSKHIAAKHRFNCTRPYLHNKKY